MRDKRFRDLVGILLGRAPGKAGGIVALLVMAGLSDAVGLAAILPILGLVSPGNDGETTSSVERIVTASLEAMGIRPTLTTLLAVLCGGTVLRAGFVYWATMEAGRASADYSAALRERLVIGLTNARWSHFVEQRSGRLANALGLEANGGGSAYVGLATLAASSIQVVVYLSLAVVAAWQVSAAALSFALIMAALLGRFVRASRQAGIAYTVDLRELTTRLVDQLGATKAVRAMGREHALEATLRREVSGVRAAQVRDVTARAALNALQEPLMIVVLAIGMHQVITHELVPFDELLFLAFLFQRAMGRVGQLQNQYQVLRSEEAALWSVLESIEATEAAREVRRPGGRTPTLADSIEFRGVGFVHESGPVVFEDFSAIVPAGSIVGIEGASGAGKTTLVDLLVVLHEPTAGVILVDKAPLADVDIAAWRSMVGYVPQDPLLLHGSIHDNVSMGDDAISRSQAKAALEMAGAWDFVRQLPRGLDAPVGERGARLSGGQRQRLAIARAIVTEPALLILDEATSGLDESTEQAIFETLGGFRGRMTVLVVSHQATAIGFTDTRISLPGNPRTGRRREQQA